MTPCWLRWARELQAIAQSGLWYALDPACAGDQFDALRYEQVRRVATEMMAAGCDLGWRDVDVVFAAQSGHATPKIDVRGAIFAEPDRVLLVRERIDDGLWTLPGGWAEVNESPSVAVAREVEEESGFLVAANRLLALWDRDRHDHSPSPFHSWKAVFECRIVDGAPRSTAEAFDPTFWPIDELPPLSYSRVTDRQLQQLHQLHVHSDATAFD